MPRNPNPPNELAGMIKPPADDLQYTRASDHPPQGVDWLWPDKIPLGKVTLLVGDPGSGKSLVALDIAARVSRAAPWPDATVESQETRVKSQNQQSSPPQHPSPHSSFDIRHSSFSPAHSSFDIRHSSLSPSSVLILSAEDELADTIRPRLDAAGADCRRIFFLPAVADLRNDFSQVRSAARRAPECRLIVIDPINAYVGPTDSHFQTVVRKILQPLARLANEKRLAVLAVAHLRKNEGAAIYRTAGSMGFVATARTVWTVCRDPANAGRHMFLPLKNNLAAQTSGLTFTIESRGPLGAPAIAWNPAPVTTPAADIIASFARQRGPQAVELRDASKWLRKALAGGPRAAVQLTEHAVQFGFNDRTLRRALHAIGGNTENRGIIDGWWWSIKPQSEGDDSHPEKLVPSQETCPLPEIFNSAPPSCVSIP
jgi:hypothetical protein